MATADQVWGPSSTERGLGGSEEAATYLSRELVKREFCVVVFGNPPYEEWGPDSSGVIWLPFYAYRLDMKPDVFVSWRNFDAVTLGQDARIRYLWVHDPLALESDQDYFTESFLGKLNGIFILSKHSGTQFPPHAQDKLILSGNGLAPQIIRDGINSRFKLLYSSWPSSGLEQILNVWPEISSAVPEAELHVYYGFDMWWATPMYKDQDWFQKWRAHMEDLLQQPGVKYFGMVGHERMAQAYAETGFYVYPTDTHETAPINLMKAMANGCIPITSKFTLSAIPEFCGDFDLGPTAREGKAIKDDPVWLKEWTEAVIKSMKAPEGSLTSLRSRMKKYARQKFNWSRIADEWERHIWIEANASE